MSNTPLDTMTVKELRDIAKEIPEVTGISAMKKDELIALISESQGGVTEEAKVEPEETAEQEVKQEAQEAQEAVQEEAKVEAKETAEEEVKEAAPKEEKKPVAQKEQKAAPKKAAKSAAKKGAKLETVKDFKDAVASLREEKLNAKKSAGKKEIAILRRRMNRLKKRSRKVKAAA
jgi:outer membrane biosynthesis protein TonB